MKHFFTLFFVGLMVAGCHSVKQVSLNNDQFYSNDKAEDKLDKYKVYFHSGEATFRLEDPQFVNDTLSGIPVAVKPGEINEHPTTPQELKDARNDVHIYLDEEEETAFREKIAKGETVQFSKKEVKEVKMLARDEEKAFATAGIIILIVLLGMLIIFLIALAFAKAADESSDGSNSNSNSGGNGGGGGSGGSDSGGSNSDSGCYIATMVYGSYDAPKVLVLRAFRDQFLARYNWGNRFIAWYYAKSPAFVAKHRRNRMLGSGIRGILNVVVWCLKPFFKH